MYRTLGKISAACIKKLYTWSEENEIICTR